MNKKKFKVSHSEVHVGTTVLWLMCLMRTVRVLKERHKTGRIPRLNEILQVSLWQEKVKVQFGVDGTELRSLDVKYNYVRI